MRTLPCHAGHTTVYISPYGDVFPCVQFPLPSGNVRPAKVHRYLAEFIGLKRGAFDSSEGLAGLLNVQPCGYVLEVSGSGVYGREYARAFYNRLRKVLSAYGNSVGQHAANGQGELFGFINSNSTCRGIAIDRFSKTH
jgi:hypothetical protein